MRLAKVLNGGGIVDPQASKSLATQKTIKQQKIGIKEELESDPTKLKPLTEAEPV